MRGLRSCKRFDAMPASTKSVTDILNTERMCLRFMQMKYELRREKTALGKCMKRFEFLDKEHRFLVESGAEDERNYDHLRLELVATINAFVANSGNLDLQQEMVNCMDILSFELTLGIEECLRSIGTERLRPERLIGRGV